MKSIFIFLLYAILCLFALCEHDYIVINEDIESFNGKVHTLVDFSNIKTIMRDRLYNGTCTFFEDMDNLQFKFSVDVFSSRKGDGDFKRLPMGIPPIPVCEGFQKFYVQFIEPCFETGVNTNFTYIGDEERCPIPAGTYYIKNLAFNTERWPDMVERGIIKVVIKFTKNDELIGGTVVTIRIEDVE